MRRTEVKGMPTHCCAIEVRSDDSWVKEVGDIKTNPRCFESLGAGALENDCIFK